MDRAVTPTVLAALLEPLVQPVRHGERGVDGARKLLGQPYVLLGQVDAVTRAESRLNVPTFQAKRTIALRACRFEGQASKRWCRFERYCPITGPWSAT